MTMADRIAIMERGEVVQVATPAEVYEAPGSRFVADFVGTVNLFEGTVTSRESNTARIETGGGLVIHTENAGEAETGRQVWYAVRPEKIHISSTPLEDDANTAGGEIWDIGYLGDMTVYHVRLDDGRVIKTSQINRDRLAESPLSWNDRAWISFKPDAGVVLTR